MELAFIDELYDWKTMSIKTLFDDGHCPSEWIEFFEKPEIKHELEDIDEVLVHSVNVRGETIVPNISDLFRTFYNTKLQSIKVVIIGQDPYHNGSAMGLAFSINPRSGNAINPSLLNIYRELENTGIKSVTKHNGDLTPWSKQGVFLINSALTTVYGAAGKHEILWKKFTRLLIEYIDDKLRGDVDWVLLGNHAITLGECIKHGNKLVASHPSPFSANNRSAKAPAFLGSGVFGQIRDKKIVW